MTTTPIIGLEVHLQLKTKSKMFCSCAVGSFDDPPNTRTCPVCLGLPGALPVINKEAVEKAILIGLALRCEANQKSFFERKNYFYPDLAKGYQVSQYRQPLCVGGRLEVGGREIRINRVHLEEDTAKSLHTTDETLLDFNKSGIPLAEIVSEPDLHSVDELVEYAKKLQYLVRWLDLSDADMEKGQFRLEPTVNLKIRKGWRTFYTPLVELKNINSFRFAKHALEHEIERQQQEFEKTGVVKEEGNKTTRGWDESKKQSFLQRAKEEARDYRYFPEPDLPPMHFEAEYIKKLRDSLEGKLPEKRVENWIRLGRLDQKQTEILVRDLDKSRCVEELLATREQQGQEVPFGIDIANWVINRSAELEGLPPEEALEKIRAFGKDLITDTAELEGVIKKVLKENKGAVADYQAGKETALQFLLGQVMRGTKGKADPQVTTRLLEKSLT